jgi:F0F1-type ATP synthase assembly protein I
MARGLSLAFEFAGAVFLFWLIGRLVDTWLGIEPWGQVIGSLIGWAGGFMHVYYATQRPSGRAGVPGKVERRGTKVSGATESPKTNETPEEGEK